MTDEQLKLELWREIMRARGEYTASGMMSDQMGSGYREPPDPVASATKALNTFNALYPPPAKKKRARK